MGCARGGIEGAGRAVAATGTATGDIGSEGCVMRKALIGGYFAVAFIFGAWYDAMDSRYGVLPGAAKTGFASQVAFSLLWPVMLPASMAVVATGGGGRWPLDRDDKI